MLRCFKFINLEAKKLIYIAILRVDYSWDYNTALSFFYILKAHKLSMVLINIYGIPVHGMRTPYFDEGTVDPYRQLACHYPVAKEGRR